uniref:phage tail tape measure protein n=1 Tax=Exiguobacterium sp. s78 TaxID=2751197 RepID=UPI001BE63254
MAQSPYNYSLVMNFDVDKAAAKQNVAEAIKDIQKQVAKVNLVFTADTKNFEAIMKSMTEDIEDAIAKQTKKIVTVYTSALKGAHREHRQAVTQMLREMESAAKQSRKTIENIFKEPVKINTTLRSTQPVSPGTPTRKPTAQPQNKEQIDISGQTEKIYRDIAEVERNIKAAGGRIKKTLSKNLGNGLLNGFEVEFADVFGNVKKEFYKFEDMLDESSQEIVQVLQKSNEVIRKDYDKVNKEQEKLVKHQQVINEQIEKYKKARFNNKGDRTELESEMKTIQKLMDSLNFNNADDFTKIEEALTRVEEKGRKLADVFDQKQMMKTVRKEADELNSLMANLERSGVKLGKNREKLMKDLEKQMSDASSVDEKKAVEQKIRAMKAAFQQIPAALARVDWLEAQGLLPDKEIKKLRERIRKSVTPENNSAIFFDINAAAADIRILKDVERYMRRINDLELQGAYAGIDPAKIQQMKQQLAQLTLDPKGTGINEFKQEFGELLRGMTGTEKEFSSKKQQMVNGLNDIRDKINLTEKELNDLDNLEIRINNAETLSELDEIRRDVKKTKNDIESIHSGGTGQVGDKNKIKSLIASQESVLAEIRQSFSRGLKGSRKKLYDDLQGELAEAKRQMQDAINNGKPLVFKVIDKNGNEELRSYADHLADIRSRAISLKNEIKDLRGATDTVGYAMRTAFEKFPVWMAASTAFYAPIQALQSMYQVIMEVDTQMTNLKRVMNADTNFDEILQGNIDLAKELGKTVTDINYAMENLAKSGDYTVQQLQALTKTATIASNVSDLSPEEMSSTMITGMSVFNIEAEKSIEIVDRLNEVDNQFPTTVKDLATGMGKAAAAANLYGVSIDELIGYMTAIQEVTRDSGATVGNSLKTIFSRITMGGSVEALKEINVAVYEADGSTRKFGDIMSDLSKKWDTLSNAQQQTIGKQLAGVHQLTRFVGLMQNYDTALKATTASENSQGSALQENARYLESAQAKVNSLEVAWQEFALTASKSIMMDGIVFGVNALKDMTNALNALISMDPSKGNLFLGIGMLTAAMGGLATLMNPTLRGFATQGGALDFLKEKLSVVTAEYKSQTHEIMRNKEASVASTTQTTQSISMMDRLKAGTGTAKTGFSALRVAVGGFTRSLGAMLLTTGVVGIALAGISAAIGFVAKKFMDSKNVAAEAEKKFNAQVKTYQDNKDSIDELVDRYENLKNKTNRTLEETDLFYQTQKQLGNYMPELVAKVDEQGRTHLATSISIKKHVEELKKLEELKAQEKINKKKTGLDETEKEVEKLKKLEEQNKKAAKAAKELIAEQNKNGNKFSNTGEAYQNAMPKKSQDDSSADRLKADNARVQTESQLALKSAEIKKSKQEIFNLERKQEAGYYSMNKEQRAMIDLILDQIDGAELYGKKNKESLETISEIKGLIQDTADAMKNIKPFDEQLFKAGDRSTQLTMIRESATSSINEIKRLIAVKEELSNKDFLNTAELTQFNTADNQIKQLQETTNKYIPTINSMGYSLGAADMKLLQTSNSMGESQKAALNVAAAMDQAADGMDNVSDSADLATVGSATLAEQLGYSDEEFRSITDRIQGYNDILLQAANGHAITAEEMMNLVMKMPELASAFKVQNGAIKLNVDAVETLRNAQLAQFKDKVQQQKLELLNGLAESKNFAMVAGSKIKSIKSVADAELLLVEVKRQQIKALQELDKADPNNRGIMHGYDVYTRTDGGAYATYVNQINQVLGQIKALDSAAGIITEGMGASIKDLNKANKAAEKQNKSTTKTEKDKQTTLSNSVYLTNKYTEAIDKATRALEKQQKRREKYAKGSRAYGEAIKKEIALLNKQIAATKAYEKALEDANKKKKLIPTTGVSNGEVTYVVDKDGKVKAVYQPKDNTYKAPKSSKGKGSSGGGSKNTKSSGKGGFVKTGSKKLAGWNGTNSPWGLKRTINGKTWTHEGIDLAGRTGDRLDSRVNGTVVHAGGANAAWGVPWQYGNCVVILSGKYLHFHAHLSQISVKTGQKVGVGQKIGEIGSTGNSTGAHLHYEIRPYNPNRKDGRRSRWGEDINPTNSAKSARTGKKTTYKYVPKKSGAKASSASSFNSTPSRSGGRIELGGKASYSGSGGFTAMAVSTKKKPLSYLNRSTNKIKRGTPGGLLKGQEALYEQLGKKYGVDPVLAMAISMAETGRGTSNGIRTYKNVGGMLDPKTNWTKHIKFDNLKQGIDSHIRNLSRNYKGMTLQQIQKKYAPSGAKNDPNGLNNHWLKNVTYFYNEMFAAAGTKSKPSSNKSKKPKTESEAKKQAKKKEQLAREKEALANQKKAEEEMENALAEQVDLRSQYYLELFTNRADMVRKAYEEFNKEEEDLRAKRDRMSGSTESGVKMDEKILTNAKKQRIKVEQEISQITKDLTGKGAKYLTAARREELLQRKKDLKHTLKQEKYEELDALAELLRDKAALRARLETVQGNKYTKRNAYLDRKKSTLVGESNTDQIKEYRYTVEQEKNTRKLFAIKKRAMDYEVKKLEEVRKKYGRTSQMYKDQFELVRKYSEELMGLEQSIIELNNAQREMLEGQADHIIDTLKEAIEQRRDAEIKAIEEVEEKRMRSYDIALNKARHAHEAKMKQMEEEQDKYNKFVDERLKAMDKEDDSHSNKKQMDEFAKSEADLRKQINRLALDDSYEAKAKRKELLKQLEDLEKERTDYLYDRNRDKQREALEDERDAYNKNMDEKK